MKRHKFFIVPVLAGIALAQQQPPAPKPSPIQPPNLAAQHKDFLAAAAELQRQRQQAAQSGNRPPATAPSPAKAPPPDFTAIITSADKVTGDREIPLPPSALKAITLNTPWQRSEAEPLAGKDGRIIFTYGQGLPNIPCEPGHFTRIEFQPGEKLDADVPYGIADTADWKVDAHAILADGQLQSYLVVWPTRTGSDTSLTVFTDRRPYDFRLLSTTQGYVSRVALRYPDWQEQQKAREIEIARKQDEAKTAAEKDRRDQDQKLQTANTLGPVRNTNYERSIGKGAEYMDPASIWDDGAHTTVRLSEKARHRDWPILLITGRTGKDTPNIHVDNLGLTFTVDGLFRQAALVSGVGRKQLRVDITNRGFDVR